jgi:hypothetical protein
MAVGCLVWLVESVAVDQPAGFPGPALGGSMVPAVPASTVRDWKVAPSRVGTYHVVVSMPQGYPTASAVAARVVLLVQVDSAAALRRVLPA